jgi:hypothetical protein
VTDILPWDDGTRLVIETRDGETHARQGSEVLPVTGHWEKHCPGPGTAS